MYWATWLHVSRNFCFFPFQNSICLILLNVNCNSCTPAVQLCFFILTFPWSMTRIRSESITVCKRWAIVRRVQCLNDSRIVSWIFESGESKLDPHFKQKKLRKLISNSCSSDRENKAIIQRRCYFFCALRKKTGNVLFLKNKNCPTQSSLQWDEVRVTLTNTVIELHEN